MPLHKPRKRTKRNIRKAVSANIRELIRANKRKKPSKKRSRKQIVAIALRSAGVKRKRKR